MSLVPKEWIEQATAKAKSDAKAKSNKIESKIDRPKDEKCSNCAFHRGHMFSDRYHYCSLRKSKHTGNGLAKTKAGGWCQEWVKKL